MVPISLAWPTRPEAPNSRVDRQASAEPHPLALLMTTELSQVEESQTQKKGVPRIRAMTSLSEAGGLAELVLNNIATVPVLTSQDAP